MNDESTNNDAEIETLEEEIAAEEAHFSDPIAVNIVSVDPQPMFTPVQMCIFTLQQGLVEIGKLGRDQSNLIIGAKNSVQQAIESIKEDARI